MKRFVFRFFLAAIGLIVLGMFLSNISSERVLPPSSLPGSPPPEQIGFVRQIELGRLYEQQGSYTLAMEAYQQASMAEQMEIAEEARQGITRLLASQQSLWPRTQMRLRQAGVWIFDHLIALLALAAMLLATWEVFARPPKAGYLLLPFDDYTQEHLGEGMHARVNFAIQEVRHTYQRAPQYLVGLATLEFPVFTTFAELPDDLSRLLTQVDVAPIAGISLPFSQWWLGLQQRLNMRRYTLGGALYPHGAQLRLCVEMRDHQTKALIESLELKTVQGGSAGTAELVDELAYSLIYHLSEQNQASEQRALQAGSWRSFQLFTQALQTLQQAPQPGGLSAAERSASLLKQVVEMDPGYATAEYVLGSVYTRLSQLDPARECFQDVIEQKDELKLAATYNLGLTYYHEFRPWGYGKANPLLTEVLSHPDTTDLLKALAGCSLANIAAQEINHARETEMSVLVQGVRDRCQAALDLLPANSQDAQARLVRALAENALGIASYYAGQNQEASEHLKRACRQYPDNPVAYGYLALVALSTGEKGQSQKWMQRAIDWGLTPHYQQYLYYRCGKHFQRKKEDEQAEYYYLLASENAFACNALGILYAKKGDYAQALKYFRRAAALNKRMFNARYHLAYYLLEAQADDQTALREAAEAVHEAIQLEPHNWRAQHLSAWVSIYQGKLDQAQRTLNKAEKAQEDQKEEVEDKEIDSIQQMIAREEKSQVEDQDQAGSRDQASACLYLQALIHHKQDHNAKAMEAVQQALESEDPKGTWHKLAAELRHQIQVQMAANTPVSSDIDERLAGAEN